MFAVDDIDDVVARLRSDGAELVSEIAQYEDICRLCVSCLARRASSSDWPSSSAEGSGRWTTAARAQQEKRTRLPRDVRLTSPELRMPGPTEKRVWSSGCASLPVGVQVDPDYQVLGAGSPHDPRVGPGVAV